MRKAMGTIAAMGLVGLLAGCVAVIPLGERKTETRTEAGRNAR